MLKIINLSVGELKHVSLTIEAGEIVCLSGASGSGKTRLLRAVADLEPHEGEVAFNGIRQTDLPAHQWRRRVMLVPAESQWWADSVAEHFPKGDIAEWQALGFAQNPLHWSVSRLSSGEKQRLALLRALALQPQALLLDEPTANLDDPNRRAAEDWLVERIRRDALPVLWVAHDESQIQRMAHRHVGIRGGRLEDITWR